MVVTATNLIQGPAVVYRGVFGATEPILTATPTTGWTDCGATKDGVELSIENEWSEMTVDQIIDVVGRRKTGRKVSIKTILAEATLANLASAAALPAPASSIITADNDLSGFAPSYDAIILDGIAPGGFRRRIILRKVLATDSVGTAYKKDDMTVVPVTWSLHYVTSSIAPFIITDALV